MANKKLPVAVKADVHNEVKDEVVQETQVEVVDSASEGLAVPEPEVPADETAAATVEPSFTVKAGTETYFHPSHINIPGVQDAPEGPMILRKETKVKTTNPSELAFPTDRWGLTRDVKAGIIAMSARICGSPEKYALAKETLETLLGYLEARYELDKTLRGL